MYSMAGIVAIAASTGAAFGLGLLVVSDPHLAARLAGEGAAIEWSQVVLGSVALVISLKSAWKRHRTGRPVVLDIVIVAGLAGILIGEVDLDKQVFGVKIIATRFFVDRQVFLPYRVLAVVIVVGTPLAVGLYALRNWRQLWFSGLDALRHPWGRVLLAAVLTSVGTQVFERPLGRAAGFPRSFLEESVELIAMIWFVIGATDRLRVLSHEFENAALFTDRVGRGDQETDRDPRRARRPALRRPD